MKKRVNKIALCGCILWCLNGTVLAAEVSKSVYYRLQKVDKLLAAKSYAAAEKSLHQGLKSRLSNYENAVLYRSLASVFAAQKNYSQAIIWAKKCLNRNALGFAAKQKLLFSLGQYYLANKQQDEAWKIFQSWNKNNPHPKPKIAIFLANIFSQKHEYVTALNLVKLAIKATAKPPKAWMQLQLALSYKAKDYSAAVMVLEKQLHSEPNNKANWRQLSDAYFNAKNYQQAASIKHLAYQRGFITSEAELIDLTKLFLQAGTPHKAAQFLQQAFTLKIVSQNKDNLELLAEAWLQAKEDLQAQDVLEQVIQIKPSAVAYEKLAQIYSRQKNWPLSVQFFLKSLKLAKFQQQGDSYLLMGISYFNLHKDKQAEDAFEQAILYPHTAVLAQQWLSYLNK